MTPTRFISIALTFSMLAIIAAIAGGCGHMAVSYSPVPLTVGGKATTPTAETSEAVATSKEGS